MTDPTDDGLRMPIPLASMKIKKPKKKKKWFFNTIFVDAIEILFYKQRSVTKYLHRFYRQWLIDGDLSMVTYRRWLIE